jgi:hypothetical protein
MAMDELKAIIARAMNDDEFKKLLMDNPEEAVKQGGFNLSPEEIETLKTVKKGTALNGQCLFDSNRTSQPRPF